MVDGLVDTRIGDECGVGMVNYRTLPTELLQKLEVEAVARLREIHGALLEREEISSELGHAPAYAMARHFFERVQAQKGLGPGELGSVASWFSFLTTREVERRARAELEALGLQAHWHVSHGSDEAIDAHLSVYAGASS